MLRWLWLSVAVVVLDQLTKLAAVKYLVYHAEVNLLPFFNLTLRYNTGAAFGFLSSASGWQNIFFIAIALIAGGVIFFMLRGLSAGERWQALALTLILGGAIGNLIDRLIHGQVVDFIDFYLGSWHFWTFNIADAAISVGAALLVLEALGLGIRKLH
jgi:signal peptidase II